jgi:hypothetical protein
LDCGCYRRILEIRKSDEGALPQANRRL